MTSTVVRRHFIGPRNKGGGRTRTGPLASQEGTVWSENQQQPMAAIITGSRHLNAFASVDSSPDESFMT